jgi:hypothetical protein
LYLHPKRYRKHRHHQARSLISQMGFGETWSKAIPQKKLNCHVGIFCAIYVMIAGLGQTFLISKAS